MVGINILALIVFIITMIVIISVLVDDKPIKIEFQPYKYTSKITKKKKLSQEILESKDFDSCVILLAEYSKEYGINKNPEDYISFKNHIDALTKPR